MFSSYYISLTGHVSPNKMHETDVAVVVISPEDREQVERLTAAFQDEGSNRINWLDLFPDSRAHLADDMQAALRSLVEPPKPEEPTGLGAVVKDADGQVWIRTESAAEFKKPWQGPIAHRHWDAITAIRVLSEGVVQP